MNEFKIFNNELIKYEGKNTHVTIPEGIVTLRDFAFYGCDHVEGVILPSSLTSIGSCCFYGCDGLKEILIPDSVSLIGGGCFTLCTKLEKITLPAPLKTLSKSMFFKCYHLKDVILPENLTHIDHSAFNGCKSLKRIALPSSVTSIGDSGFENCESLKEMILPNHLKSLGKNVFFNTPELKHLVLSKDLENVGEAAFESHGPIQIEVTNDFILTPQMFDSHYNYDAKIKNEGKYQLVNCYLPYVTFDMFKPFAKVILLVNYLETYPKHTSSEYKNLCIKHKEKIIDFLTKEKRYIPLHTALEEGIFTSKDIEPYFDRITNREERAKIMEYKTKETSNSIFDDLESELFDLF